MPGEKNVFLWCFFCRNVRSIDSQLRPQVNQGGHIIFWLFHMPHYILVLLLMVNSAQRCFTASCKAQVIFWCDLKSVGQRTFQLSVVPCELKELMQKYICSNDTSFYALYISGFQNVNNLICVIIHMKKPSGEALIFRAARQMSRTCLCTHTEDIMVWSVVWHDFHASAPARALCFQVVCQFRSCSVWFLRSSLGALG